ncbi:MAG: hypothetical protein JXK16_03615 [Thiotrichales bacterium]|nr:hypothetical protein [Thiotrichales bacterium]
MEKQSDLNLDAMQCKFDLAGKLWLQLNQADWQEAAFVLQAQKDNLAIKKALAKVKVVWVPTEQVTLMSQFVPGKRKQDWLTALPYSLEESLAEPVENLHFVVLNRDSAGLVSVAIISKVRMQHWVEQLQMMGLGHVQLVADCFQLPTSHNHTQNAAYKTDEASEDAIPVWSVFHETDQRSLVRTGEYSGFAGSPDWYQQLLQLQTQLQGEIQTQPIPALSATCQSNAVNRNPCQIFNLRTGVYQPRSQQAGLLNLWMWPSVLLGLFLVVYLVGLSVQTQKMQSQAQAYQTQTEALFKQRFPEVKRIINIRTQAKTAFQKNANSAEQGLGPSQLITFVEPLFKKYPTIQIKQLDWKDRSAQLAITLQAPQVSALQNLAKEIKAIQPSELKVKNVSQTVAEGVLYVDAK